MHYLHAGDIGEERVHDGDAGAGAMTLSTEAGWAQVARAVLRETWTARRPDGREDHGRAGAGPASQMDTAVVFTTDHGEMLGRPRDAGEAVVSTRRRRVCPC